MKTASYPQSAPARLSLLLEARTVVDVATMLVPLLRARRKVVEPGSLVIVVPGFGSDDRYTLPLRHYLTRLGYQAEGWGLGKNLAGVDLPHTLDDLYPTWDVTRKTDYRGEASVPYLCDRVIDRVRERHSEVARPVTLVGWSLGGYLAREAARDLPDVVDRVITMGSPTIGGPKYTAAAGYFRRRGMDLDWIESEVGKREARPIRQPITAIYSKNDAIVSWKAAIDHYSENIRHVEVNAPHLGLGFNRQVWRHVTDALEADPVRG